MTIMVPLVLFGWIPAVILLFSAIPPRRAMIVSFLLAWMFLPVAGYTIAGLPDYTKVSATSVGVLLATVIFDSHSLTSLRLRMLDVPMVIWCLCPFASSMANGLGAYDGLSAVLGQTVTWGVPYLLGRAYLKTSQDFREVAFLLFVGGLIYVPFCVWEIRMSPNLHGYVYGFGGTGISYSSDLGNWGSRPRVFMGDGLTLGMFMTAASLVGTWLWTTGSLKRLFGIPGGALVLLLVLTSLGCKNMGALSLLIVGLTALFVAKWWRTSLIVYMLLIALPLYMVARPTGQWSGKPMVDAAALVHEDRARSLQFRLDNEDMLAARALERPFFGWGGWGRNRVYDELTGRSLTIPDGLWIIALGTRGVVGLVALTSALLLPALLVFRRYPPRYWTHPAVASPVVLALLVVLYVADCLFNAMLNPIYLVITGGMVSLVIRGRGVTVIGSRAVRELPRARSGARVQGSVPVGIANPESGA